MSTTRARGGTREARLRGARLGGRALASFVVLAIAISWITWPLPLAPNFGPLLAAVIVVVATTGRAALRDLLGRLLLWRVDPRWWVAAVSPGLLLLVTLAGLRLAGQEIPASSDFPLAGSDKYGLLLALAVWLAAGLGEEVGWRGYALPQLQRRLSPLAATLALAPLWWLWHFEFFVTEAGLGIDDPVLWVAFVAYLLEITCVAIVLTWLYNRSRGSLLLVVVWHALYNFAAVPGLVGLVVVGAVVAQSVVLVLLELRAAHLGRTSVLGGLTPQRAPTQELLE